MVVSGVPKENGNLHAREIACMSLDLVAGCRTFVIPHMTQEPLKIRVGVHSGEYVYSQSRYWTSVKEGNRWRTEDL
jgi:atrial natriuretic peptide receptor A